mgnify:CR=1 FL=1
MLEELHLHLRCTYLDQYLRCIVYMEGACDKVFNVMSESHVEINKVCGQIVHDCNGHYGSRRPNAAFTPPTLTRCIMGPSIF